jgi:hypothetical protein
VPQGFTNPYPYFQNLTASSGLNQEDFFNSPEAREALKKFAGRSVGTDFSTGQRDVDWAADMMGKLNPTADQLSTNPFTGTKPVAGSSVTENIFGLVPSTQGAANLTPTQLGVDDYVELYKKLEPDMFKSSVKQNLLGLGSAAAFGAASLPFTEYMRNQEFNRQQQAFKMREESPTAQAARNLSLQQQASLAGESYAQKMAARSAARRAAIEPLIRR